MDLIALNVEDDFDEDERLEISITFEAAFLNREEVRRLRDHLTQVLEKGSASPCRCENPSGPDCGCGFGKCDKGLVY